MPTSPAASRTPLPLIAGFALFLVTIGYAVAASVVRPSVTTYEPSATGGRPANGDAARLDTITLDATDDAAWRYLDLERGSALTAPDTAGWDLAFRRHTFIAAAGVRDLGDAPWDSVTRAPAGAYAGTPRSRNAADPALSRWYHYRMLTHVLEPKTHVYVVKTSEGRYAKLQILSYYCPGPRAGCPTVRYTLGIGAP